MGWSAMGAAAAAGLAGAVLALRCRAAAAHSADQLLELRRQLEAERLAHEATERKRKQEKAGRSKAERDKRSALKESDASSSGVEFPLAPIGTVASCFLDCAATPRQPGLCPDALIKLEFDKRLSPEIFEGLFPEHSHVWIIYIFHKNTNPDRTIAHLETWKTFPAKIQPPRRHAVRPCGPPRGPLCGRHYGGGLRVLLSSQITRFASSIAKEAAAAAAG